MCGCNDDASADACRLGRGGNGVGNWTTKSFGSSCIEGEQVPRCLSMGAYACNERTEPSRLGRTAMEVSSPFIQAVSKERKCRVVCQWAHPHTTSESMNPLVRAAMETMDLMSRPPYSPLYIADERLAVIWRFSEGALMLTFWVRDDPLVIIYTMDVYSVLNSFHLDVV